MRVDPDIPYQIVFSLNLDSEIGPIIEPYVVQLTSNNTLSLTYQRLYVHTMDAFKSSIDDCTHDIISITSEYSKEKLTQKFCKKKDLKPQEFIYSLDDNTFDKMLRPYIEKRVYKCLALLENKSLYLMGKSGNPAHLPLHIIDESVSVRFHFKKEVDGTHYYPTFRSKKEKLTFVGKEVEMITNSPCILLVENLIYYFEPHIEGIKLKPFFKKWNIYIPKAAEPQYYKRFIAALLEKHDVIAEGFSITTLSKSPFPILKMIVNWQGSPQLNLLFDYGKEKVYASEPKEVFVKLEKAEDTFNYFKVVRQLKEEEKFTKKLKTLGLIEIEKGNFLPKNEDGKAETNFKKVVDWISQNQYKLEDEGFLIQQDTLKTQYFIGNISLDLKIKDCHDWFDLHIKVRFDDFVIPFIRLKKYILNEIREFPLPDGRIALIPEDWFFKYKELLSLTTPQGEESLVVKKFHFTIIDEIMGTQHPVMKPDKEFYLGTDGERNKVHQLPEKLAKSLRPYQKEGFFWMQRLRENNFGGCLADDMGLGKTLQTLSILLSEQNNLRNDSTQPYLASDSQLPLFENEKDKIKKHPSLIIMPTSLIHNWEYEILKWAPALRVIVYTGLERTEKLRYFHKADIVLTTYGTARNDIETLQAFQFNYIVLDESQIIKNPTAKVSKAVKLLRSYHRLSLTGTPIENSLNDLWSQMSFLNPGLLGSYQYFKNEFSTPIEKKNDEYRKHKLRLLIKPFILRRTKEEVAADLPELVEKIYFSEMNEEQRQIYDQTRNFYRKQILENMEQWGEKRAQFYILRGLMHLRLIANHPNMFDSEYKGPSGKFEDISKTLESILEENHRVLIFSQFVKHLDLIARHLDNEKIPYAYLTGQTRDRAKAVNTFKDDPNNKVFLISLKAGGVGLNLTEADYVFLCDPWWNPAAEKQAISRAHRIGQNKKVISFKFISKNTVEEKILLMQERKLKLSADFIHSGDTRLSREDIETLFN